jgi:hypothetical protein
VVRAFANGEIGSNMLAVSSADPDTSEKAQKPEEKRSKRR